MEPYYTTQTSIKPKRAVHTRSVHDNGDSLIFSIGQKPINGLSAPKVAPAAGPLEPYFCPQKPTRRVSVPDSWRCRQLDYEPQNGDDSAILSDSDDEQPAYGDGTPRIRSRLRRMSAQNSLPPATGILRSVSDNFVDSSDKENDTPWHDLTNPDFSITDRQLASQRPDVFEHPQKYYAALFDKSNLPYILTNDRLRALSASLRPPPVPDSFRVKDDFDTLTRHSSLRDDFEMARNDAHII